MPYARYREGHMLAIEVTTTPITYHTPTNTPPIYLVSLHRPIPFVRHTKLMFEYPNDYQYYTWSYTRTNIALYSPTLVLSICAYIRII